MADYLVESALLSQGIKSITEQEIISGMAREKRANCLVMEGKVRGRIGGKNSVRFAGREFFAAVSAIRCMIRPEERA